VFEDSPNGIRAAQTARIFTIGEPREITKPFCCHGLTDLELNSLAEMLLEDLQRGVESRDHYLQDG